MSPDAATAADLRELAMQAKAWPFAEARTLLERIGGAAPGKGHVLFETGYGPSGLPHIGTFAEVVRTTMVRRAFDVLSDVPTRLVAFSDDMDGLRKVPDNVPRREMLAVYAERKGAGGEVASDPSPLTSVPDPFGEHASFAHHNNARLRAFLDRFGFEYEFMSSTDCYASGAFNEVLIRILERYEEVRQVVLPELGAERRKTYTPIFPVVERHDPALGGPRRQVLHRALVVDARPAEGVAVFQSHDANGEPDGEPFEHRILDGGCKAQWRVDWALRWVALGVDYEMSGKDLIDSVRLSGRICRILGGTPPAGFTYELFLDEKGEKISKSKGNGLTVDEWLEYAPEESLSLFMYHQPRRARKLFFDVIPKTVDEYLGFVAQAPEQAAAERLENPAWHIHGGVPPADAASPLGFGLLLNLASVANAEDEAILWGFIARYAPDATAESAPMLARLVRHALAYYRDFIKPAKAYRAPDATERAAMAALEAALGELPADAAAEDIQTVVYEIGKAHPFETLRDWFRALYEVLLGQSQGPRMGSFIALYGLDETRALIRRALAGEDLSQG